MEYKVHKKENLYFGLRVFFTLVVAAGLGLGGSALLGSGLGTMAATIVTFAVYALAIAVFFWFQNAWARKYFAEIRPGFLIRASSKYFCASSGLSVASAILP